MNKSTALLPIVKETTYLTDALNVIGSDSGQIALVVSDEGVLRGTITDGDVRRHLLLGATLGSSVTAVMNNEPHALREDADVASIRALIRRQSIHQVPLVDDQNRAVG